MRSEVGLWYNGVVGQEVCDHERILRRRGGELLPPVAEDIARAREERTAQIVGETVQ